MIDLHCHILPGIDDGATTIDDSIEMAKLASEEGITHILATPHHLNRNWINKKDEVENLVFEVQRELDINGIDITLFPGQEVRISGELLKNIKRNEILFIDEQKQYLLIEFPTSNIPEYTERLFYELEVEGIIPVIVHPERNREILENPNKLKSLVDKGALSQLTAASYTGGFGKEIQKLSTKLIESNMVHFIASDAHNITNRAFHMEEALKKVENEFGLIKREQFEQFAKDLVNGEVVVPPSPTHISKKKKFFGLF